VVENEIVAYSSDRSCPELKQFFPITSGLVRQIYRYLLLEVHIKLDGNEAKRF
jgi:hypothetical protein